MYRTKGRIIRNGRAIVVDLSDSRLEECFVEKPHMTILFSRELITNKIIRVNF